MSKLTETVIDGDIISRAIEKDPESMRAIYEEYSCLVWNLAMKFTGNKTLAEDAASAVFIKLFKNLGKFKGYSSFKTWLYRLAVNTIINFTKSERRRSTAPVFDNIPAPRDESDDAQARDLAERMLAGLDPREKALMILREIEGMSYSDIAETLQLKLPAVKTRIYRARMKLRKLFEEEV